MTRAALLLVVMAFVGCGEEREAKAPSAPSRLSVTVYPKGPDHPGDRRVVDCETDPVCDVPLAPTPPDAACTEIYGGPATATVKGTVDGRAIDAEFSRNNGCEIARWDDAEALLGPAPRRG